MTQKKCVPVDDDVVTCDAVAAIAGTGGVPLSLSLSRSFLGDLAPHRLNHKLGLRSNSFDDRPSSLFLSCCASRSLSTLFSFSFSFSATSSLPLMNREGTGGTGGVSTTGLRGATTPSAVDGRILELPGEVRREWKRPEGVRTGVAGEMVAELEVPGIRIAGSDFLRVGRGRASDGMRGGEAREGDEGALSIGGRDGTVKRSVAIYPALKLARALGHKRSGVAYIAEFPLRFSFPPCTIPLRCAASTPCLHRSFVLSTLSVHHVMSGWYWNSLWHEVH